MTSTENEKNVLVRSPLKAFIYPILLSTPIKDIVEDALSLLTVSRSLFITAYGYIKMAEAKHDELRVSLLTVRHLLATSIMLAAKGYDERYERNSEYADAFGIFAGSGLNKCEELLFNILGQNLFLSKEKFAELEEIWEKEAECVYIAKVPQDKDIVDRKRKHEDESDEKDQRKETCDLAPKRLKF